MSGRLPLVFFSPASFDGSQQASVIVRVGDCRGPASGTAATP
ncbi:MAG: hypothetical protein OXN16_10790 [Gammaproteobacteria bacterium]|nr:hypothetical protein [Gammaproteobacteria bacterium]